MTNRSRQHACLARLFSTFVSRFFEMETVRKTTWNKASCWVASFDILGFKELVNVDGGSIEAELVQEDYEETLSHLESRCKAYSPGCLDYLWFSDTFVMFTPDDSAQSYTLIQQAAKHFIEECIYSNVPIRGAVSVGSLIRGHDNRSLLGRAFIDAHVFGEDQNWLGLILTPDAIRKAKGYGLEPTHHDFISSGEIPMRKYGAEMVVAYRFQNGSANYSSPLLLHLESMKQGAGHEHSGKYERTIAFIKKHYRYVEPSIG